MVAASNAFLVACLDQAVRRIVLIDAPAVLGLERWREADQSYYLTSVKALIRAATDQRLIEDQPVDALAHIILAAMLIARGSDKAAASIGQWRARTDYSKACVANPIAKRCGTS